MNDNDQTRTERRTLLANLGAATVAGLSAVAGPAQAVTSEQSAGFEPARHEKDAWLDRLPGTHRVFVDSSTVEGGGNALRFGNNVIQSHIDEYDGKASDIALVICFRHGSTPYGYNDAIWAKYGAILNRNATPAPTGNPMSGTNALNGQTTITSLVELGAHFAICNRSTLRWSQTIASETGNKAEDIHAELAAGLIPNGHLMAAGVLAATRAQEYRYSYLYAQ